MNTPRLKWEIIVDIPWVEEYYHFNCPKKNYCQGWDLSVIEDEDLRNEVRKALEKFKIRRPAVSYRLIYPEAFIVKVIGAYKLIDWGNPIPVDPILLGFKEGDLILVVQPNYRFAD